MPKNEFIGFRIELPLQQSLSKLIKSENEFKSITEVATRALSEFLAKYEDDELAMSHPDYPEILKIISTIDPVEARKYLYELIGQIKHEEVSSLYSLLSRFKISS